MGVSSGCHFILKWQPDDTPIRLSFYFEMTTGWGCHPVILKWQPDDILIRLSFFLKCESDGVSSDSYFFARMNRIWSVVELKFYIRVQEEDIRVQEEFVFPYAWWVNYVASFTFSFSFIISCFLIFLRKILYPPLNTIFTNKFNIYIVATGVTTGRRTKIQLFLDKTEESPLQLIMENHRKTKKD